MPLIDRAKHDRLMQLYHEMLAKKQEFYRLAKEAYRFPIADYELKMPNGSPVKLSELFGSYEELIIVHNMGKQCPWCTMWADGFNGVVHHLEQQAAFVVSTPDPPDVMRRFARSRGWAFNMVSTQGSTFKKDLGFEDDDGNYHPGISVLRKLPDGSLLHVSRSGLGPGDDFCSVWYFFDLLDHPDPDWNPAIQY